MEWEKIFANCITNKGVISYIHTHTHTHIYIKNSYNSVAENNPIKKMGRGSEQTFFKEDVQMANRHMKRC